MFPPGIIIALHLCVGIAPAQARGAVFAGSRGAGQGPSRLGEHSTKLNSIETFSRCLAIPENQLYDVFFVVEIYPNRSCGTVFFQDHVGLARVNLDSY